jgi:hypothetical protein
MSNKKRTFDFFEIDLERLDEEWVNQPVLYHEYSTYLTEAKEAKERAEVQLEVANDDRRLVRAQLDLKIRKDPTKFLGPKTKLTETAITNRILTHKKYIAAQQNVYNAKETLIKAGTEVSTYYTAVFALDHRKTALEKLVSLFGQDYFASPRAKDGNSQKYVDKANKKKARKKRKRNPN